METKKMVWAAILAAISVIIDTTLKLVIPTQLVGVPFYAIPIIVSAIFLGPKYSIIIAFLGDFVTLLLAPGIPFYPLFSLASTMWGIIPGFLLYKKKPSLLIIGLVVFITHILVTALNSYALMVHYHASLAGLLIDLPLRLLLIIPNTMIITAVVKSIIVPIEDSYFGNTKPA